MENSKLYKERDLKSVTYTNDRVFEKEVGSQMHLGGEKSKESGGLDAGSFSADGHEATKKGKVSSWNENAKTVTSLEILQLYRETHCEAKNTICAQGIKVSK